MKKLNIDNFKEFKKGDLIITTSGRSYTGCPSVMWSCYYDHDIDISEAIERHFNNIKKEFPALEGITIETVTDALKEESRVFVTTDGHVVSYRNHEKADIFDKRFFEGEEWGPLYLEKKEVIKKYKIPIFNDHQYRVYPEMLP